MNLFVTTYILEASRNYLRDAFFLFIFHEVPEGDHKGAPLQLEGDHEGAPLQMVLNPEERFFFACWSLFILVTGR